MKLHTILILSIFTIVSIAVLTLVILHNAEVARLSITITPIP